MAGSPPLSGTIVLVGCGNMGRALLAGWLAAGLEPASVHVVEPDAGSRGRLPVGVVAHPEPEPLPVTASAVVLAVKPQQMAAVAPRYRRLAEAGALVLSIAAGRTLAAIADWVGGGGALVRAMPNTPASIGRGISVACAGPDIAADQRRLADWLLAAAGEVAWVEDEALLDAVTAVSGSGPAYVFLLAECLAEAGIAAGLPPALAERLARATVAGAGELLHQSTEAPAVLRRRVTSPGGTTAAALDRLMAADGLRPLLTEAVARAARRARDLAG
jgi:pyrroline-5-carboxylate reductase